MDVLRPWRRSIRTRPSDELDEKKEEGELSDDEYAS